MIEKRYLLLLGALLIFFAAIFAGSYFAGLHSVKTTKQTPSPTTSVTPLQSPQESLSPSPTGSLGPSVSPSPTPTVTPTPTPTPSPFILNPGLHFYLATPTPTPKPTLIPIHTTFPLQKISP